jgi:predicted AlkP superfamily pyrophosphatase or phosphodiesterase
VSHGEDTIKPEKVSVPQNAILVSWDGLDRTVLQELLFKGKLPNLAAIIDEGSLQSIEVQGHVTLTKPSHAEMLTGLGTKDTGVISNNVYQPIPEGYTIFERLQKHFGGKENIHTFMVTGKLAHVGGRTPEEIAAAEKKENKKTRKPLPEGADNVPDSDKPQVEKGEPFMLTRKALEVFDAAQRDADEVAKLSLRYLEQYKSPRFMAFVHFSDPDHAGHKHRSDSDEYRDAAVDCDKALGKIVRWLKKQELCDKTLLYVTTDHGFDPAAKTHNNAPHSWLATNDKMVMHGGTIADVPATILVRFGVDISKLEPKLIGVPLTTAVADGQKPQPPAPADGKPKRGRKKK